MFKKALALFLPLFLLGACKEHVLKKNEEVSSMIGAVLDIVDKHYVDEVPKSVLIQGAMKGMLSALDQYTMYLPPSEFKSLRSVTKGHLFGIGVEIVPYKGYLRVVTPLDGSPAQKAGLLSGDLITHINGEPVLSKSYPQMLQKIKAKNQKKITLRIARKKEHPFNIDLKPTVVQINAIKSLKDKGIGYIRLSFFDDKTASSLKKKIKGFQNDNDFSGLILDLRNNPGGTLEQAVAVADLFLDKKHVVSLKGRDLSSNRVFETQKGDIMPNLPMVVLVNRGSASASEIVAGSLKVHKRAVIMGDRTFGKGTAQVLFSLPTHGGVKITTARFTLADDTKIGSKGIAPDIPITVSPFKGDKIPLNFYEKVQQDRWFIRASDLIRGVHVFDKNH